MEGHFGIHVCTWSWVLEETGQFGGLQEKLQHRSNIKVPWSSGFNLGLEFRHGADETQKPFLPDVIRLLIIISILADTIVRSTSIFELEKPTLKMICSAIWSVVRIGGTECVVAGADKGH